MLKFNNSIVPNKVRIGWHFSSNKYAYRDVYSALKSSTINMPNGSPLALLIFDQCSKNSPFMEVLREIFFLHFPSRTSKTL